MVAAQFKGAPFVALHLRGSDKMLEDPQLVASIDASLAALANIDPSWPIFVLTDDNPPVVVG